MNKSNNILELARFAVKEGEIEKAIDLVWERLSANSSYKNDFALLNARLQDTKRDSLRNVIDNDVLSRQKSKIINDFLQLVGLLTNADLDDAQNPDKIAFPLFVLTPNVDTQAAMQKFFPFEYFREIMFDKKDDYLGLNSSLSTTLVIFDHYNHDGIEVSLELRDTQMKKLKWIIDNTTCSIVWFGDNNDIVKDNRKRIGAANFPFTLYARIKEMIDFLKYYQDKTK